MKKVKWILALALIMVLCIGSMPVFFSETLQGTRASGRATSNGGKVALILDTDVGTDDSQAFLIMKNLGINPDYIVATGGNGSAEDVLRNAVVLKTYYDLPSKIVQGKETALSSEKNTFHGPDGFAGISEEMVDDYGITENELDSYITTDQLVEELGDYDAIEYIAIGPLTTLSYLCENEEINNKIDNIYLMGGGIYEFNCSNDTEFNFSKNPKADQTVLASGRNIILFTLDLTNHQRLSTVQIDALKETGNLPEDTELLEYNLDSNEKYNKIDAAVLHDTMPILYYSDNTPFETLNVNVSCDDYGHLEITQDGGYPVAFVISVDDDLLFNQMMDAFRNVESVEKKDMN